MDTNIDNLIQCISDSIKRKDEEIEKLKTTLAKYEYKIKELKEENEGLIANRIKAAYDDGYGTAISKMIAFLNKVKFEPAVDTKTEQELHQDEFEKAIAENPGECYFCVYDNDLRDHRLEIIYALSKACKTSLMSARNHFNKFIKNTKPGGHTTILNNVSEDVCKIMEEHVRGRRIGYSWDFIV